jgi:hypothetical protein
MRFMSLFVTCTCAFAAGSAQLFPQLPVRFEHPSGGVWSARGLLYSLAFTPNASIFQLGERALTMRLLGADPGARFEAGSAYSAPTQYFTPSHSESVQSYRRLRRLKVYPGVDMVFYGSGGNLEYDFEIAAGADPSLIRLRFEGADRIRLALNGELLIELGDQTVTQHVPVVYQTISSGARRAVHAAYQLDWNRDVTLRLDDYDKSAPLTIDPVITFAGYLPGSSGDSGVAITHDAQGFVYVAGNSFSPDFVATGNAFFGVNRGTQNTWLMKLSPTAPPDQVIVYSSYFGGTGVDSLKAMTVDTSGLVYLTGSSTSTDLTTVNAFQSTNAGAADAFVAVFDPTQSGAASLLYATYLGGGAVDEAAGIAVQNRKIYLIGSTLSDNFPTARPLFPGRSGGRDIFVTELDSTQSGPASMVASSYLGGSGTDYGRGIAVDAAGLIYLTGLTYSNDITITPNAYHLTSGGSGEAFLMKMDITAPIILYSTYLGGAGFEDATKVVVDPAGRVALAGYTSSPNFPVTQNAFQPLLGGPNATNAFLTILDITVPPSQALIYSTYFGGSFAEAASDLRRDARGRYAFGGFSFSPDLPVSQNTLNAVSARGGLNGFVAVIDPAAPPLNSLVYSSYITGPGSQIVNGVDIDATGAVYVTGSATSNIFPAGQQTHYTGPGNADAFVFIFLTP